VAGWPRQYCLEPGDQRLKSRPIDYHKMSALDPYIGWHARKARGQMFKCMTGIENGPFQGGEPRHRRFPSVGNPGLKLRSSSRIAMYCASLSWAAFRTERWLKKQPRAPIDGNPAGSPGRIARKNSALHPTFSSCSSIARRLSMRCSRFMTKISAVHVTTRRPAENGRPRLSY
jgi:hypothetical protein